MDIPFHFWHIIAEIFATFGAVLGAEQVNSSWNLPEDEYLPRKRRKLSKLFVFIPKNKPVRWRAYWMHRIAQYNFWLYLIILLGGRILTHSFDFVSNTVFVIYPVVIALSRLFWEAGIFIYVKYKKYTSKRRNEIK